LFSISGLGHAFEKGEEYGDETTIMGFSSSTKDGPRKCFNGQNLWHFGWFNSRAVMVDPFQVPQLLELAPFVDYDKTESYQPVLITVFDMHIVYNRAKGFNAETSEYQDKVTVAKEQDNINSELLAVLDTSNPKLEIPGILGTAKTLIIEICESVLGANGVDYYAVSIGLDESMCAVPTSYPTEQTPEPTPLPTLRPTPTPTRAPAPRPSPQPTTPMPFTTHTSMPTFELPELILGPPIEISLTEAPEVWLEPSTESPRPNWPPESIGSTRPPKINLQGPPIQAIDGSRISKPPDSAAITFAAVMFAILVTSLALLAFRWNQRRLEEQRRNLRILQYNASSQVKKYMQDPVK